jgi:hypothetical protein
MKILLSGITVSILCAVHVLFPNIERALHRYKHIWVQWTGGMAIGYVFMYMLPKLSDDTSLIISNEPAEWEFLHYRLYLIAMIGLLTYLLVDIWSASKNPRVDYWKQIQGASFCFYNLLIGYMLFNIPRTGILPPLLTTLGFGAHLMGMDHLFYKWHANYYKLTLKWLMTISLVVGWLLGFTVELPETFKASSTAFIAGGILINVITEKLPDREDGHFGPFLAGVGLFVVIAIVMRSIPRI